ncbi:MAG: protein translocase subunit SecD [Lachnospiraceae bacterium]|nr:protein translocase subunit SecD [Lachnospiraceae bacterium]
MNKGKSFIALVAILAVLAGLAYIAFNGIGETKDGSIHNVSLGLDLAGGVSITYGVAGDENPSATDMADTQAKLRRRVERYSTEAQVYTEGNNRISIEIPGVNDADQVLRELGQPGNLYFIREKDSAGEMNYSMGLVYDELPESLITTETTTEGDAAEEATDAATEEATDASTEEATDAATEEATDAATEEATDAALDLSGARITYMLDKTIEELQEDGSIILEGSDVAGSEVRTRQDQYGANEFVVSLSLTKEGTEKFAAATTAAVETNETIAIYYDGEIISAPTVQNAITDGNAVITGSFTAEDADQLATTIRIGGLKLQLEELRSNVVGAQLGQDAIQTSLKAAAVGFGLVVIFMIVMYLMLGLAASIALAFYVCIVIILLGGLGITLTLPGIAGIILSVGMAVDANVLVFARIREELSGGKNVKDAMKSGYAKALSAIIDGNITTLIAAVVLMLFGSGPVKGFAHTLTLGICVSMVTALFITRLISTVLYGLGFTDEKYYGKLRQIRQLPIIEKRKVFYAISAVMIGAGLVAMAANGAGGRGAMNFSLDFVGGTSTSVEFNEQWTLDDLDSEIAPKIRELTGVSSVQIQTVAGTNEVVFKTTTLDVDKRAAVHEMLQTDYGVTPEKITAETISATISREMGASAIRALLVAMVLILIYIYIRFSDLKFGFSAILALAHDALVVIACYALTRIEVGSTFVAVVLTIIGYSINDTIVTFDRLRENQKKAVSREKIEDMIDKSVSQTLTRSLFTSVTTFLMVLCLFIFGVTDIRYFALPLMVGVVCGTYSSICLASPLWYEMKKQK